MRLPKFVLVHVEPEDPPYLVAHLTLEDAAPGIGEMREIGVYKLVGRRRVTTWPRVVRELRV